MLQQSFGWHTARVVVKRFLRRLRDASDSPVASAPPAAAIHRRQHLDRVRGRYFAARHTRRRHRRDSPRPFPRRPKPWWRAARCRRCSAGRTNCGSRLDGYSAVDPESRGLRDNRQSPWRAAWCSRRKTCSRRCRCRRPGRRGHSWPTNATRPLRWPVSRREYFRPEYR